MEYIEILWSVSPKVAISTAVFGIVYALLVYLIIFKGNGIK